MRILVLLFVLTLSQPCLAQESSPEFLGDEVAGRLQDEGWSITIGAAPVVAPAWEGSKDMVISIFPDLRVNYGDMFFASIPDGVGFNVINGDGWKAGPLAKFRFGREEDGGTSPFAISGGSSGLAGLGKIDASVEVGGFVEKDFGSSEQFQGRLEVLRGFGGHEGVLGEASLSYQLRSGRSLISIGPRATMASREFTQVYFGIDAAQSENSGLERYAASGGLVSYGIGGSLVRPLNRGSVLTLFSSLERLGDVAADSPLVRDRGQEWQFSLGLGFGYRFGL